MAYILHTQFSEMIATGKSVNVKKMKLLLRVLFIGGLLGGVAACGGGGNFIEPQGNDVSSGGVSSGTTNPQGSLESVNQSAERSEEASSSEGVNGATPEPSDPSNFATLSWVAPVTRSDGSPLPLSELSGYRIYSGLGAGRLDLLVDIDNSGTTEYTVLDLETGTHYFAVAAYNLYGVEGELSEVVSKTIN